METVALHLLPSKGLNNDPRLSLAQFKELYQEKLKAWLVEGKHCLPGEAKDFSSFILLQLKQLFCGEKTLHLSVIWQIIHKFTSLELSKARKSMEKNFGLTEPIFNELLVNLQKGEDDLFEQLFLSHFEDCMKYLQRTYRASHEDAYDATMETMLEFLKRMKAGKVVYGNLRFLFTQMASQVYLKWLKKERPKSQLDGLEVAIETDEIDEETLQVLHKSWEGLCVDCKAILKNFYYDGISLKAMAGRLEKSPAALRKQKQRCVEKLRGFFAQNI